MKPWVSPNFCNIDRLWEPAPPKGGVAAGKRKMLYGNQIMESCYDERYFMRHLCIKSLETADLIFIKFSYFDSK